MWWILHISMRTFFVLRKSSFLSWPCRFFSKWFSPNPGDVFNWSSLVKACKFAVKRDSIPKFFLEVTKGIERLQNAFDEIHFSDSSSEQVTITWRTTSLGKSILTNTATKIGIHHILFCGDNFTSKNFKKLSLLESLFNIIINNNLTITFTKKCKANSRQFTYIYIYKHTYF